MMIVFQPERQQHCCLSVDDAGRARPFAIILHLQILSLQSGFILLGEQRAEQAQYGLYVYIIQLQDRRHAFRFKPPVIECAVMALHPMPKQSSFWHSNATNGIGQNAGFCR
jgi:hypothetical protein